MAEAVKRVTISIEGMHCGNCAAKVQAALGKVAGVSAAEVDLAGKVAKVSFDPGKTNAAALMQAVGTSGFRTAGFVKG